MNRASVVVLTVCGALCFAAGALTAEEEPARSVEQLKAELTKQFKAEDYAEAETTARELIKPDRKTS